MKDTLLQNKKGVSEIISYVILIIIAISIGALVFTYLSNIVPKDLPECNPGLSLSLEDSKCTKSGDSSTLELTVKNTGRFNITASYIRIGQEGKETKIWINTENTNQFQYAPQLGPNDAAKKITYSFKESEVLKSGIDDYILEIQIASFDQETKKYASCPNAITRKITCNKN